MSSRRRDRSGIEPVSVISFAASFALPQADCALPATSLYAPLASDVLSSVAAPTNRSPWPTALRTPPSKLSLLILTVSHEGIAFRENTEHESSFHLSRVNFR